MKMIVSDYDGTLRRDGPLPTKEDIAAIKYWQKQGNLFCLNTGRGFYFDINNLPKYDINCDFYICNTGATIYDKTGHMIYEKLCSGKILAELLPILLENGCKGFGIENDNKRWAADLPEAIRAIKDTISHTPEEIIEKSRNGELDFHQMDTYFEQIEKSVEMTKYINNKFGDILAVHRNNIHLDITSVGISKATGINVCLDYLKKHGQQINREDIFAVGDNMNDYEMIKEFDGYTVTSAVPEIIKLARKAYPDFVSIVEDNL